MHDLNHLTRLFSIARGKHDHPKIARITTALWGWDLWSKHNANNPVRHTSYA
jgi:hypothetical protein